MNSNRQHQAGNFQRRVVTIAIAWLGLLMGEAGFSAGLPAQPASTNAQPGRYLFILNTSAAMGRCSAAAQKAVGSLLRSSMHGQLNPGDTIGMWTFNEDLYAGRFPLQRWRPEDTERVAANVTAFMKQQRYEKRTHLEKVLPGLQRLVKASDRITVLLITAGDTNLFGTPYDREINEVFKEQYRAQQKAKMPFIVVLRARRGEYVGCTVNPAPWPVELPEFPPEPKIPQTPKAPAAPPPQKAAPAKKAAPPPVSGVETNVKTSGAPLPTAVPQQAAVKTSPAVAENVPAAKSEPLPTTAKVTESPSLASPVPVPVVPAAASPPSPPPVAQIAPAKSEPGMTMPAKPAEPSSPAAIPVTAGPIATPEPQRVLAPKPVEPTLPVPPPATPDAPAKTASSVAVAATPPAEQVAPTAPPKTEPATVSSPIPARQMDEPTEPATPAPAPVAAAATSTPPVQTATATPAVAPFGGTRLLAIGTASLLLVGGLLWVMLRRSHRAAQASLITRSMDLEKK